jgi:hypothetical protein
MIEYTMTLTEAKLVLAALEVVYGVEGLGFTDTEKDVALDAMETLQELVEEAEADDERDY